MKPAFENVRCNSISVSEINRGDHDLRLSRRFSKRFFHFSEHKKRSRSQGCIDPFDVDFLNNIQSSMKKQKSSKLVANKELDVKKTEEIKNLEKELTNLPDFEIDTHFTEMSLAISQKLKRRASSRASFSSSRRSEKKRSELEQENAVEKVSLKQSQQLSLEIPTQAKCHLIVEPAMSSLPIPSVLIPSLAASSKSSFLSLARQEDPLKTKPPLPTLPQEVKLSVISTANRPSTLFAFENLQNNSADVTSPVFSLQLPTSPVHTIPIQHRIILKFIGCWAELSKQDFHSSTAMESETLKFIHIVSALGADYLSWGEKLIDDLELIYPVVK